MSKIFRRFIAYTIDMMVVMLIAQSLSGIPQINKQLDTYNKYYKEYTNLLENYSSFRLELADDFEDEELSEEEYQSLTNEHENYRDILVEKYADQKLTKKEYEQINKKISQEYEDEYEKLYYQIEKNSVAYFIIYLITVLAYFIGFNKFTGGQTLGKKLTRLKIVNAKDSSNEVSVWSYLIRAIILYQIIQYFVKLIGVFILSMNDYYTVTTIFYNIQYYLEFLIIIMIIVRLDGRGLHDLLAKTRVVLLDRNGNEVEEKIDSFVSRKLKSVKDKKIIDEVSDDEKSK